MMKSKNRIEIKTGLTLVEVLIATTLTLLLMLSLAQGFKVLSESVSEGRTRLALSDQLRGLSSLVRHDLDRCTVDGRSPQPYPGSGYLKYYDGPIWDSTALQANFTPENPLAGSRWGDIDDILMLTAKARPGDFFRGTVPRAVMVINQLNQFEREGLFPGTPIVDNFIAPISSGGANFWRDAWATDVTIQSEYAEIAWFMMPLAEGNRLPIATPYSTTYIPILAAGLDSIVDDRAPVDGMPDRIALCRRVLLVRSDIDLNPYPLNTTYRNLIQSGIQHPISPRLALPMTATNAKYLMNQFYQRCDLSMSPHVWERAEHSNGTRPVYVKSNSLLDLQLPERRFAHFTAPVSTELTTLPALALTDESTSSTYLAMTQTGLNWAISAAPVVSTPPAIQCRGFMLPSFMRCRLVPTSAGSLVFEPTLGEIIATNVLAFDVKAFDPAAKLIAHQGSDTVYGDTTSVLPGLAGTDDVAVSPSDPGYGTFLASGITPVVASIGTHVDMGWGYKLLTHPAIIARNNAQRASVADFFRGNASGIINLIDSTPSIVRDPALILGGALSDGLSRSRTYIFQPNFDTYTDYYDLDGERFSTAVGGGPSPENFAWPAYRSGWRRLGIPVPQGNPDVTGNGVHNLKVSGESIPPAPYELPSIKVTIRVQDVSAGALQQISVVHGMATL